jgi:hypothetical protein
MMADPIVSYIVVTQSKTINQLGVTSCSTTTKQQTLSNKEEVETTVQY